MDFIQLYILPKKLDKGFQLQIYSIFQYIAKTLFQMYEKQKKTFYPELPTSNS